MFELVAWAAEIAHETAPAAKGGIAAIGVDIRALLFQVLNFAILLWVLKRFAYAPIVRLLEARRQKIEESLKTADRLAEEKESLVRLRSERLAQAEAEADVILSQSKNQAGELVAAATQKAQHQAEQIEAQAKARVAEDRRALETAVGAQTLSLVKTAAAKVLRQKLDEAADEKLIARALKEASLV